VTWRCRRESDGEEVAVKARSLRGGGWDGVKAFEREAQTLRALAHPCIPAYIDAFEVDEATDRAYCLVQRLARGQSLQALIDAGDWRPSEKEIEGVGRALLGVLGYLGELRPPVVHRDVKPLNVVLDRASGEVALVDFGGVAAADANTLATVVGTFGFAAPEQLTGRASPASDLYGLGATLLFLLCGRSPSALPQVRLAVDLSGVACSPRMRGFISRLMEPVPEERFASPEAALRFLDGAAALERSGGSGEAAAAAALRPPAGSQIEVQALGAGMVRVTIPPQGFTGATLATGSFAAAWLSFIALWTGTAVTGGAPLLFTAFSAPFWVVGGKLAQQAVLPATERTLLELFPGSIKVSASAVGFDTIAEAVGDIADAQASDVRIVTDMVVNDTPQTAVELPIGVKTIRLGQALSKPEQRWLVKLVQNHIDTYNKA